MKISLWRQDKKGDRWCRVGVVVIDPAAMLPFRRGIPHGDDRMLELWPRLCWYSLEKHQWDLFDHERKEDDAVIANGNS